MIGAFVTAVYVLRATKTIFWGPPPADEFAHIEDAHRTEWAAPLVLGLNPALRLPAVVLEIVAGIVVGPSGLDWVHVDAPVAVLALLGLAMLLFLSGLEVDLGRLRGALGRAALAGFGVSFAVALAVGLGLDAAGLVSSPVFVAIVLSATSLGVVIPVLKDAGLAQSDFGQLVIAAARQRAASRIRIVALQIGQVEAIDQRVGGNGSGKRTRERDTRQVRSHRRTDARRCCGKRALSLLNIRPSRQQ